jgi:hypothetical protein
MPHFFDTILRRQHQREKQQQLRRRAEYLKQLAGTQWRLTRLEARQNLDGMVLGVMEDFRKTAYPKMKFHVYEQGWSLGLWVKQPDGRLNWVSIIDILLRYDPGGNAQWLDCSGHNHQMTIPIDPEALAAALLHIYRPRARRGEQKH